MDVLDSNATNCTAFTREALTVLREKGLGERTSTPLPGLAWPAV